MPEDKPNTDGTQQGTKPAEPKPAEGTPTEPAKTVDHPAAEIVVEEIDLQQTVENAVTRAIDKLNLGQAKTEEGTTKVINQAATVATGNEPPKTDDKGKEGTTNAATSRTTTEKPRSRRIRIFRGTKLPKL